MSRDIYWIDVPLPAVPGRLAILSRPRAGEWLTEQLAGWHAAGVHTVVSLLEAHEVHELDLRDVPRVCARQAIDHISFPIADRGVPASRTAANALARDLAAEVGAGRSVAVHCRAGIGRSVPDRGRDPGAPYARSAGRVRGHRKGTRRAGPGHR